MFKIIEITKIVSGKNIRNERDTDINELAESIETNGLINPLLVKPLNDGRYEVIAGHRRYEAIRRLGFSHVECNITDETSEKDLMLAQIAENVQRKDMSASEYVEVFDELKERFGVKQNQIARYFNKSQSWVTNQYQAVRLLDSMYGNDVPAEMKKKSVAQIKAAVKKNMAVEAVHIFCKGMSIKTKGHTYTITCLDSAAENALRQFIQEREI